MSESQNNQWITIINPQILETATNNKNAFDFFLSHRHTLGNKHYLYKNLLVPMVVISSLVFSLTQLAVSFVYLKEGQFGDDSAFAVSYSLVLTLKVIPFIILSVIYYKMPSFDDEFFVTWELQRLFLCLLLQIVCIYGATFMQIWTQENLLWNAIIGPCLTWNTIIFWHVLATYICTGWVNQKVQPILIKHKYRIRKVNIPTLSGGEKQIDFVEYKTNRQREHTDIEDSVQYRQSSNLFAVNMNSSLERARARSLSLQEMNEPDDEDPENDQVDEGKRALLRDVGDKKHSSGSMAVADTVKMTDIIAHEKAFTLFMTHLASEFSMEILLSIYELLQYKNLVRKYANTHHIVLDEQDESEQEEQQRSSVEIGGTHSVISIHSARSAILREIKLPTTYPKSYLVYNDKREEDLMEMEVDAFTMHCKRVVYVLYERYIKVGSSFEVNLSFYTRKKVADLVNDGYQFAFDENIQLRDLFYIFDDCIYGIFGGMTDSYDRFTATHQYKKLKNLMFLK